MRRRRERVWSLALAGAALVLAVSGTGFRYQLVAPAPALEPGSAPGSVLPREALRQRAEHARLARALRGSGVRGIYVIIDQTHNRLRLMRGTELLLEAPCSTGSGMVLKEGRAGRVWIFDTPQGRFSVLSKLRDPVWRKPDWAFVEEGVPVPKDPADRLEYGALGEYALYLGDGYLIHGTLYERLIGRSVSHGCIRVGREALRELYRLVPVGAPVFIY